MPAGFILYESTFCPEDEDVDRFAELKRTKRMPEIKVADQRHFHEQYSWAQRLAWYAQRVDRNDALVEEFFKTNENYDAVMGKWIFKAIETFDARSSRDIFLITKTVSLPSNEENLLNPPEVHVIHGVTTLPDLTQEVTVLREMVHFVSKVQPDLMQYAKILTKTIEDERIRLMAGCIAMVEDIVDDLIFCHWLVEDNVNDQKIGAAYDCPAELKSRYWRYKVAYGYELSTQLAKLENGHVASLWNADNYATFAYAAYRKAHGLNTTA
ncbi:hypothetical protein BDV96DRAFT_629556 [Lophiotrema nucula]|uniref:Uncharacterized protein n=1 Tax=Lophiotrema nucula TaxID=690887 RepID=A0A6A5ZHP5_9PLEO|nr:hypothetical protein BDV96DRAFT_629556 [Lophiotrema nucula]